MSGARLEWSCARSRAGPMSPEPAKPGPGQLHWYRRAQAVTIRGWSCEAPTHGGAGCLGVHGSRGSCLNCWAQETKGRETTGRGKAESWTSAHDRVCWAQDPCTEPVRKGEIHSAQTLPLGTPSSWPLNLSPPHPQWRCEH